MLTLVMLVSCFPMNLIAKTSSSIAGTADGPLSLTAREGKSGFATGREGRGSTANTHHGKLNTDRFELSSTPFSENDAAASLRSGDEVTFIVVLKSASLLGNYSVREISERTEAVKSQESKQIKAIDSAKKQAAEALGKSKHEFGFDYTVAMTGFSVTTAYGNRKKLEALNGVESVYVAPTFALPETDYDLAPLTNNSSTMIGSDILNSSGYGGKGMRIAILDTGILVTHPNFAALPDDKLDDPIQDRASMIFGIRLMRAKAPRNLIARITTRSFRSSSIMPQLILTYRTHMQVRITERMLQVLLRQTRLKEVRLSVLLRTHSLSLCRFSSPAAVQVGQQYLPQWKTA